MRLLFFRVCRLALGAFLVAVLIQMLLPPDVAPEKKALILSQLGLEVENAVTYHRPTPLQYTEDQVNEYLSSALKSKKALNKPWLDFKRAIVGFTEGKCSITAERSFFGFSVYTTTSFAVQVADGAINASNKGGAIGRLPIYPQVMQYLDIIFEDLWTALDRERKLAAKANAIEFHEKSVVLQTAPVQ